MQDNAYEQGYDDGGGGDDFGGGDDGGGEVSCSCLVFHL